MSSNTSLNYYAALPYYQNQVIYQTILQPVWPLLICIGLISNAINVIVFLKTGVRDSVSTLLFTLSISDACFLSLISPTIVLYIWNKSYLDQTLMAFHFLCYWPAMTFYDFSSYISVFPGVTRCACVVKSLHFKSMFTKNRTVLAVCIMSCFDVLLHVHVLSISRLGWRTDPLTNYSYLSIVSDNMSLRQRKMRINDFLNKKIHHLDLVPGHSSLCGPSAFQTFRIGKNTLTFKCGFRFR